jgi:hypothetical protein
LDELMKTRFTAPTRPRRASGVACWITVWRITTLMLSSPPSSASATSDREKGGGAEDDGHQTEAAHRGEEQPGIQRDAEAGDGQSCDRSTHGGAVLSRPRPAGPT